MSTASGNRTIFYLLQDFFVILLSIGTLITMLGVLPGTFFGHSASAGPATVQSVTDSEPTSYEVAYPTGRNVIVNGAKLSAYTIRLLSEDFGYTVQDGEYWYDPYSGAWGLKGGPSTGFIRPNLNIGGTLQADASGVGTFVFVNGRELHQQDLHHLQSILGSITPGRYWLDARGYFGYEGNPPTTNIIEIASSTNIGSLRPGANPYYAKEQTGILFGIGKKYAFYDSGRGCRMLSGGGLSC